MCEYAIATHAIADAPEPYEPDEDRIYDEW